MTVLINERPVTAELQAFIDQVVAEAEAAFSVFRETNTITANGTVGFIERVPGEELLVSVNYGGPWNHRKPLQATVTDFTGNVIVGKGKGGLGRYTKLFQTHADITTISHVHSPYLGAWAQTQRSLPISYVPVQRYQLSRELPVYIDRRQDEVDFILERLAENPYTPAILEANGGATVWGRGRRRHSPDSSGSPPAAAPRSDGVRPVAATAGPAAGRADGAAVAVDHHGLPAIQTGGERATQLRGVVVGGATAGPLGAELITGAGCCAATGSLPGRRLKPTATTSVSRSGTSASISSATVPWPAAIISSS